MGAPREQVWLASFRLTPVRSSVLVVAMSIVVPLVFITCLASGLPTTAGVLIAVLVSLLAVPLTIRAIPAALPDSRRSLRTLFVVWVVLSLSVSFRLASMSLFMLDAGMVEYAVSAKVSSIWTISNPESKKPTHNCFTAYAIAAHLAAENVENLYRTRQYHGEQETAIHQTIGDTFTIDPYQYPPPFLIIPRLILAAGLDFFQARTYWFVLNVLALAAAVGALVGWLSGHEFNVYWLTWPLLLAAPAMLSTLQAGNAQCLIVSFAVLAMVAFERKRDWLGGPLLAFAIVSKIFPGVLLLYLLVRRRWRAATWTIGAIVVLCAITVLFFGVRPFQAFFQYQLPRLASGQAVSFSTKDIGTITANLSVIGIPYKLEKLGMLAGAHTAGVAAVIQWLYTALVAIVVAVLGTKHGRVALAENVDGCRRPSRVTLAQVWLVVLVLAQLRSPFLPWGYGNVAILTALAIAIPASERSWRRGLMALGWLVFAIKVPEPLRREADEFGLLYGLATQLLLTVFCLLFVVRQVRFGSLRHD